MSLGGPPVVVKRELGARPKVKTEVIAIGKVPIRFDLKFNLFHFLFFKNSVNTEHDFIKSEPVSDLPDGYDGTEGDYYYERVYLGLYKSPKRELFRSDSISDPDSDISFLYDEDIIDDSDTDNDSDVVELLDSLSISISNVSSEASS